MSGENESLIDKENDSDLDNKEQKSPAVKRGQGEIEARSKEIETVKSERKSGFIRANAGSTVHEDAKTTAEGDTPPCNLNEEYKKLRKLIQECDDKTELKLIVNALFENDQIDLEYVFNKCVDEMTFKPSRYWAERDRSLKETPAEFIRDVYGSQLDGTFTRADLRQHDLKLYQQFLNWAGKNKDDPVLLSLNLPKKSELNTALIAEAEKSPDRKKELSRTRQVVEPVLAPGMAVSSRISGVKSARKYAASSKAGKLEPAV